MTTPATTLHCNLPMYSLPNCEVLWKQFTADIISEFGTHARANKQSVTIDCSQAEDLYAYWQQPTLLLGQSCTFPLLSKLYNNVTPIGCWSFSNDSNSPGQYASVIVTHKSRVDFITEQLASTDLQLLNFAANSADSLSGYWQLLRWLRCSHHADHTEANQRAILSSQVTFTGSHLASIKAVTKGAASIASIDNITYRLLQQFAPELCEELVVLDQTANAPALPLIMANEQLSHKPQMLAAMQQAIAQSDAAKKLGIDALVPTNWQTYLGFATTLGAIKPLSPLDS